MNRLFQRYHKPTNAESIDLIPAQFISNYERALYRQRALVGEDVYAYQSAGPRGTWNIWDTDTRIVQALIEKRWSIASCYFMGDGEWHVIVRRGDQERDIRFHIELHAQYDRDDATTYGPGYQARAHRRIHDVVNHCAYCDKDPAELEGGHF